MADVIQYGARPKPADLKAEDIVPMRSLGAYGSDYLVSLGFGSNRAGRAETMARSIGMNPSFLVKYPAFTALLASLAGGASGAGLAAGLMQDDFSKTKKRLFSAGLTFGGASLATLLAAALRRHKMEAISRKFDEAPEISPSFRKAPPHHFLGGAHASGRLMAVRKMLGLPDSELSKTQKAMYAAYSIPYVDAVTLPVMNVVEHVKSHAEAEQLPVLENAPANDEFNQEESSDEKAAYWRGFKDRLEKRAVTLEQLRAGTKGLMAAGKLMRNSPVRFMGSPINAMVRAPRAIETAALAVAPAEVQQTAKRLLPLVGNKVHATSEWSNRVRKLFRFNPRGSQRMHGADNEFFNRAVLKHEADELRYGSALLKRFSKPGVYKSFYGHVSPSVILQEHNALRGAGVPKRVAATFTDARALDGTAQALSTQIPGFAYGASPRLSRHALRRIDQLYAQRLQNFVPPVKKPVKVIETTVSPEKLKQLLGKSFGHRRI